MDMGPKEIKDAVEHGTQFVPFVGLAMQGKGGAMKSPLITRLLESAIMGGVLLYGTVQVVGNDVTWIKGVMVEMREEMKDHRKQLLELYQRTARSGQPHPPGQ